MPEATLMAVIITATLDLSKAAETILLAREGTEVSCMAIIVWDYERRGVIRPANAALVAAMQTGAPYIVWLNDDVRIAKEGWLKRMIEVLEADPHYGIAAASGRCRTLPQSRGRPGAKPSIQITKTPLAWFCAVVKRQVFEEVGLFDENLIHYAGDTDMSRRAHKAGWKSVWVKDVYVEHEPGRPIGEWWEHDLGYYGGKWG